MLRIYDTEEARSRAEPEHLISRGQPKPAEEA
jgi:ribosomal protein S24E